MELIWNKTHKQTPFTPLSNSVIVIDVEIKNMSQLDDSDFVMPNENNDEVPKEALIIAQTSCIESSHQRNKDKNDKHENLNGKKINILSLQCSARYVT